MRRRVVLAVAALVALGLGVLDPIGWDQYGPIRWALLPALGFWAIAGGLPDMRFDRSPINLAWAALLGWGAVASIFAADPLHAWIGTPDRQFGWLTWLLCGGLFLLMRSADGGERRTVVQGFVVGSIAIGAHIAVTGLFWGFDQSYFAQRIGAQFGQPAYLGAAAALALPICVGLAADRGASDRWRIAAAVAVASSGVALLASRSRAAWLGAAIAGGLWLLVNAVDHYRRRTRRDAEETGSAAVGSTVTASGLGTGAILMVATVALIVGIPGLRRRLTSATGDGGVIQGRTDEWQVGARALGESPLFGYGAEGYRTVFGANVDAAYIRDWGFAVITDRAHSGVLDAGLSFGVPGALAYAVLIILVVAGAVAALRTGDPLRVGLAAGVVAYAVQQQFLFPLSEVDPMFWVAAGLIAADPSAARLPATAESILRGLLVGVAAVATVAGALNLAANARLDGAIEHDRVAGVTAWRPDSIRYHFIAANVAENAGDLNRALGHLEDGLDLSPADPAFTHHRARVLLEMARAMPEGPDRAQALDRALEALTDVAEDQPLHAGVLQLLGTAQALDGQFNRAVETMELAVSLAPENESAAMNLQEAKRLRDAARP
jgi:O-antigen ligase